MSTTSTTPPQTIVDLILSDILVLIPNFSSLVSSYRLLVGSAEEISRIPGACPESLQAAITRFDNAGVLIDILLELLCCKITFSANLLEVTCAPIDLLGLLSNRPDTVNLHVRRAAEDVLVLEGVRRIIEQQCSEKSCFPPPSELCLTTPAAALAAIAALVSTNGLATATPASPAPAPTTPADSSPLMRSTSSEDSTAETVANLESPNEYSEKMPSALQKRRIQLEMRRRRRL